MNIRIKKLDDFGRGIAFVDSKITFIPNALKDELIEYKVVKNKRKYQEAEVLSIFQKNQNRIHSKCPYFSICGGCHLQHMSFSLENEFKVEKVKNILKKFAGIVVEDLEIVSGSCCHYRNKITLSVVDGKIGLLKEKSNELVEINQCYLIHDRLNKIIEAIKALLQEEKEISKIMLRIGNKTNEVMVAIEGNTRQVDELLKLSDSLIINQKVISRKYITSYIMEKKFQINYHSFFQVNDEVVEYLYQEVIQTIKRLGSKRVIDLYCGVGTIGISISPYVEEVIGVEVLKEAVYDANRNMKINNVQNISFIHSKVEDILDWLPTNYDTIIVDPPRSGLDSKTRRFLMKGVVKYLIYISCDPVTLARDLRELKENYQLLSMKLFNMFPRTYHVECCLLLCLKEN